MGLSQEQTWLLVQPGKLQNLASWLHGPSSLRERHPDMMLDGWIECLMDNVLCGMNLVPLRDFNRNILVLYSWYKPHQWRHFSPKSIFGNPRDSRQPLFGVWVWWGFEIAYLDPYPKPAWVWKPMIIPKLGVCTVSHSSHCLNSNQQQKQAKMWCNGSMLQIQRELISLYSLVSYVIQLMCCGLKQFLAKQEISVFWILHVWTLL